MNFLDAMRTGRPMRRTDMTGEQWIVLGTERTSAGDTPRWRNMRTGYPIGLWSYDYLADDWEVMP